MDCLALCLFRYQLAAERNRHAPRSHEEAEDRQGPEIRRRAESWSAALGSGEVIPGESTVGGGSLPGETLPTYLLALRLPSPDKQLARLRRATPPVVARLQDDCLVFDPRTVLPEQEPYLLDAIRGATSR